MGLPSLLLGDQGNEYVVMDDKAWTGACSEILIELLVRTRFNMYKCYMHMPSQEDNTWAGGSGEEKTSAFRKQEAAT